MFSIYVFNPSVGINLSINAIYSKNTHWYKPQCVQSFLKNDSDLHGLSFKDTKRLH